MLRAHIGKKLFPILWDGNIAHPFVEYKAEEWNWSDLVKTKHFPYLRKVALGSSAKLWLPEREEFDHLCLKSLIFKLF